MLLTRTSVDTGRRGKLRVVQCELAVTTVISCTIFRGDAKENSRRVHFLPRGWRPRPRGTAAESDDAEQLKGTSTSGSSKDSVKESSTLPEKKWRDVKVGDIIICSNRLV